MTQGRYGGPRNVLIVSTEDSASIDLKPRLEAAGADHERWHLIVDKEFLLPRDLYRLEDLAAAFGDVGMIVIDPIGNNIGGVDTDKEGAVRNAIAGLNRLADEVACMVLGVRHLTKSRLNGALSAVLGSTAWVDLPRAVLGSRPTTRTRWSSTSRWSPATGAAAWRRSRTGSSSATSGSRSL